MVISCLLPYSIYFNLYPVIIPNTSIGFCNLIILYIKIKKYYNKNNNNIIMYHL